MPKAQPLSLAELLSLLPRVQSTLELLVGKATQSAARAPAPAVGRRRRADSGMQQKLVLAMKGSKAGLSLGQLVKAVGGNRGAVKYHLRALRAQKKARVKGDRKLARWMAA